jgi:uncharacterized ion transporter superfamily protein YfcC
MMTVAHDDWSAAAQERTDASSTTVLSSESRQQRGQLHPILVILGMMLVAAALTYVVPAGRFERVGKHVVAGSYRPVPKENGLAALLSPIPAVDTDTPARAAGAVAVFAAIPAGMVKSAPLFFMVMIVGGAFGLLRATGTIDAGVDRLLHLTAGNIYLLSAGLMTLLACGSTFMGFSSEYIALIPVVLAVGKRLGLPALFAPMIIALADFVGYTVSVTNPIVLGAAQPLAGVPLFSGLLVRLSIFLIFLTLAIGYVLFQLRRAPKVDYTPDATRLSRRQTGVLLTLVAGGVALITGTSLWSWESPQLAAAFIALGLALAVVAGMRPGAAADAFLDGMKGMLLPCLLIGLASATGILLQSSQIIDSIVQGIGSLIEGQGPGVVGVAMMAAEMVFGVLIPSASAKAAVSVPILAPIAHLSGVGGQVTVTALLLGSGMTNMINPANPLLLAFLAAAGVRYADWFRFVWPLFLAFTAVSFLAIYLMTITGA